MFIVNVILKSIKKKSVFRVSLDLSQNPEGTHINRHLVHMNTLLDAKLRHQNIESSIKNIDNFSLTDHWAITMGEVRNENAKEQMC